MNNTNSLNKKISFNFRNPFSRVSIQDQVLFAKHLSVMTKAGMPLLDSLQLIKKQTKSKTMARIIDQIVTDVSNGQFLSASMEKYRNIFGDFAVNIIRVGEASGILYENLTYLAEELKKRKELRGKVMGALAYPMIILVATTGIVGILTMYVFPKILPIFKSLRVDLPPTTIALIFISDFMTKYGIYLGIGILLFAIIVWQLTARIKPLKFLFHQLLLMMPIFGKISQNYNLANFSRTLGLLLKSDIKVVEALFITSDTLTNLVYKKTVKDIADNVTRGGEISQHMADKTKLFPVTLAQMIAIGEKTGNLSESLLYLSEYYEGELNDLTKNLSTILEPILMIVMGVIVGFIALSIITPIYEVTKNLKLR